MVILCLNFFQQVDLDGYILKSMTGINMAAIVLKVAF